ncbi:cysteine desulfurase [alpha proteobacterium U9-1i]|nr:cysteine desulfurase [alpha proteobacterium U9-1i]
MTTKPLIYCDYNAGAPVRAEAAVAVARALAVGGNPSSVHGAGRRARALIEDAREKVGAALDSRAENVVFTSGATEAVHLALTSAGAAAFIVSSIEHDAAFEQASRSRDTDRFIPVGADGVVRLDALEALLQDARKPALVVLQLANNETGVIQPIARAAALCRQYRAMLLVDAAQGFGRIPVSIVDLDATYLVVSSHKLGGPPGVGALVLAPGAPFVTSRFGGGQERGRRPGTENLAAIAGFGVAVEYALGELETEQRRVRAMRDRFEANLPKDAIVFGASAPRLPNTSNFAMPGVSAETAVIAMDIEGVAVSSGAACSSGKVRSSRVLKAMGVAGDLAKSALRVSFGHASKETDVDAALAALTKIAARRALVGAAG